MKISYIPVDELIINRLIVFKYDDYITFLANSTYSGDGKIPEVSWCNGVLFQVIDITDRQDQISNVMRLDCILCSELDEYKSRLKINGSNSFEILVTNLSSDESSIEMTNWIKKNKDWKK